MSIKETIRAEIERRLKAIANSPSDGGEMDAINGARCLELMSFRKYIDSLPEQPASKKFEEKDFVEEVRQYYSNNCTWDALKQPMLSIITRCARHFAEWGAEWQKEQMMDEWLKDRDGCFWNGVEEGKKAMEKRMMDGAVEFECIGKKVKMTIQELINYYIDQECCNVADECGF